MGLYDEVRVPALEMRLPGDDGRSFDEEVARCNEVGPRYGLEVAAADPGVKVRAATAAEASSPCRRDRATRG